MTIFNPYHMHCRMITMHLLTLNDTFQVTHILHKLNVGQHHEIIEDVTSSCVSILQ